MRFFLTLLLILTFSSGSQAATTYYWLPGSKTTAYESCVYAWASYTGTPYKYSEYKVTRVNDVTFNCQGHYVWDGTDTWSNYGNVTRVGDSCANNFTYDPATGSCVAPEPDKCESTAGSSEFNEVDGGVIGSSAPEPPGVVCKGQCQFVFSYEAPTSAYRFVGHKEGKDLNHAYFKYRYQGNGLSCTQNESGSTGTVFDQPASKDPMSPDPVSEALNKCTEWTTTGDGSATRTCTVSNKYVNPGKLNCSSASGTMVCSPGTPSPNLTDVKKTETQTNTPGSGGGSTTNTTTENTTLSCKGVSNCTTSGSTTTSSDTTNADGTKGDSTSSCSGDACGDDSEEDAEEECDPNTDPSKCGESSVSGGVTCEVPPVCDGDAIQCSILHQSYEQRCADELARDYSKAKPIIEQEILKAEYQLQEETVDGSGLFNTGSRFLPSTCPVDKTYYIESAKRSISISYSYICTFASSLSYLVVALASLFFVVYVGRSFGGE